MLVSLDISDISTIRLANLIVHFLGNKAQSRLPNSVHILVKTQNSDIGTDHVILIVILLTKN